MAIDFAETCGLIRFGCAGKQYVLLVPPQLGADTRAYLEEFAGQVFGSWARMDGGVILDHTGLGEVLRRRLAADINPHAAAILAAYDGHDASTWFATVPDFVFTGA